MRPIALALPLLALAGCATTLTPSGGGTRTGSLAYGFAFSVPAPYEVQAWAPESLSVGQAEGEGFASVADLRVYTAGEGADFPSFETFALWTLRNMCAADGPGETIACGEAERRQPFVSAAGLEGEVLYLTRTRTTFATGAEAVDGFGPVFLFDVSDRVPGDGWAALAVQPPASLPAEEVDSTLLRRIAESLSMEGAG